MSEINYTTFCACTKNCTLHKRLLFMQSSHLLILYITYPLQVMRKLKPIPADFKGKVAWHQMISKNLIIVCKPANLLQNLPDFLIKAHWHPVEGSIQPPPAKPLSLTAIQCNRNTHRAIKRLAWSETVLLAVTVNNTYILVPPKYKHTLKKRWCSINNNSDNDL